jgi:tetratricopeptide (TPR) repeat protein
MMAAEVLYQWAGKNVSKHRLKFYYASCSRALYHFLNEEHEPALQLVIEAKELFEEQNDQVGIGCCLILMGCIYRTLGNRDLALKTLWEGSRKLKSGHCPHIQLAGSYHMGCIYFEMGSIEEAIHHFKDMENRQKNRRTLFSSIMLYMD